MKKIYGILFFVIITVSAVDVFSQDWHEQTSGTTENLNGIWFADIFNGWAVGDVGTILHTNDGGFNWEAQTSGITSMLNGVYFTNDSTGWVVGNGGKILFTSDAGLTWTEQTSGTALNLYCLSFVDSQRGWIGGQNDMILFTDDGGATWVTKSSGYYPNANGIFFLDSLNGWVAGNNGLTVATADGGNSWAIHPSGVSYSLEDILFLDSMNGFAVGQSGSLVKSTDAGATWQIIDLGITEALLSIVFTDTLNGWIAGTTGTLLNTTDGGQTWSPVTLTVTDNLRWIHFVNSTVGFISGNSGTILKTIPQQEICMVTVDDLSLWNMVVWEKVENIGAMYYKIYKKTSGVYDSIGVKYYDEMSEHIDYASTPNVHSDFYKISVVDSMDNEHPLSPYHKTINMSILQGVPATTMTLIFDEYEDEGGTFQALQYYIYRGPTSSTLVLYDSVEIGVMTYDDMNVYDAYTYRLVIDLAGDCIPTSSDKAQGGPYSQSFSNLEDNAAYVGISQIQNQEKFSIYPNPFEQRTTIEFSNPSQSAYTLIVTDITGKIVKQISNIISSSITLNRDDLSSGFYTVELSCRAGKEGENSFRGKIIIK